MSSAIRRRAKRLGSSAASPPAMTACAESYLAADKLVCTPHLVLRVTSLRRRRANKLSSCRRLAMIEEALRPTLKPNCGKRYGICSDTARFDSWIIGPKGCVAQQHKVRVGLTPCLRSVLLGLCHNSLARASVVRASEQNQCKNESHIANPLHSAFKVVADDVEPSGAGLFGISLKSGPGRSANP